MRVNKILKQTLFYLVVAGIILVILTPIYFLVVISLMSDQEAYDWPTQLVPSFFNNYKLEIVDGKFLISVYSSAKKKYSTLIKTNDFEELQKFVRNKTNSTIKKEIFDIQVKKLNELISKNSEEISNLRNKIASLESKLNTVTVNLVRYKTQLEKAKKANMNNLISIINEKIIEFENEKREYEKQIKELNERLDEIGSVKFSVSKHLFDNYVNFFRVTSDALPALFRSIQVAILTVLISLTIGGMAGYAFARYNFKGKNLLKLSVLFVRMFPGISIAMPMVIILINMGFYDKPIGLSLVYSVGQIGMTIWITASIFMGISKELEEAAMIFGTTRWGAFFKVTLPLALPGLAASAMYAFIGSWSETAQAIVLTQFNPTFPVVVYQTLVGAKGLINLTAAGGVSLALPAVIFTLIIRRYILQMWGGVKV
ncbi:sugar ABC transporter permease [Thermosipho africanus H17ap60334]|jgi:multiple sugar transport system permease protein|uniref:Sugar abc transporter, permease protein n=1 Tax=Thermosipho africanus (strain TCF52B) TaxID=484019 RepID=B7IEI1_THEAB|nr:MULTISPECIES: carbohydrate ABC transporter permease [Thermosipho]HCF38257.1 ABC transporter permease [Thermosipho africanus]ACJ76408.1 sugar abc transporter, permease protein [Thermosipho africanus TCF52B]EKF49110.1 sugar ABC transporter permease [Thermosipho africanus H17ap60334]MBZ4649632.1 sugar abc transporter, permease protein [Thermosipho sp. (in: thermotogales)]MDK2840205.1 multiple sugar transport system permease protein [Thermosipho sp. (in: thermotogales)]